MLHQEACSNSVSHGRGCYPVSIFFFFLSNGPRCLILAHCHAELTLHFLAPFEERCGHVTQPGQWDASRSVLYDLLEVSYFMAWVISCFLDHAVTLRLESVCWGLAGDRLELEFLVRSWGLHIIFNHIPFTWERGKCLFSFNHWYFESFIL